MRSYRELKAWQLGLEISDQIYAATRSFPKDERIGMVSQMRRAAVSIPANIAEGHARDTTRDYLRFLSIARGSLAELETLVILAVRQRYLDAALHDRLLQTFDEQSRMLRRLQSRLREKIDQRQPSN